MMSNQKSMKGRDQKKRCWWRWTWIVVSVRAILIERVAYGEWRSWCGGDCDDVLTTGCWDGKLWMKLLEKSFWL